jgi:hypothetical protein
MYSHFNFSLFFLISVLLFVEDHRLFKYIITIIYSIVFIVWPYSKKYYYHFVNMPQINLGKKKTEQHGYDIEEFTIETEDNYILSIFRIFKKNNEKFNKRPVYLQHGLLESPTVFLLHKNSIAYQLVDEGYGFTLKIIIRCLAWYQ